MTRIIALSLAIAAGTMAQATDDDYLGMDSTKGQAITAKLSEQGYVVRKIERDDGLYEAYATRNGERYEIYLDSALEVVKTERDD